MVKVRILIVSGTAKISYNVITLNTDDIVEVLGDINLITLIIQRPLMKT